MVPKLLAWLAIAGAVILAFSPAHAIPVAYTATRLVIPANAGWDAGALAEDGRAGGYVVVIEGGSQFFRATLWDQTGAPSTLSVPEPFPYAVVMGFKPDGTPVGQAANPAVEAGRAGYWGPTGFATLPDFGQGARAFSGNAMTIVGQSFELEPGGEFYIGQAAIWDSQGVRRVVGLDGLNSGCWSVNSSGTYVGVTLDRPSGVYGGFVGQDGTATLLNYAGFPQTRAFDINDDGWFSGIWQGPGSTRRAYVARGDDIRDLGLFPGFAESWAGGINDDRTIVGGAANFGLIAKALVWYHGEPPQDLNLLTLDLPAGTILRQADHINNAGQILVRANNGTYILTPIPEPAALAMLLPALLLVRRLGNSKRAKSPNHADSPQGHRDRREQAANFKL
jgi:hypothetical protein